LDDVDFRLGLGRFEASLLEGVVQIVVSPGLAPGSEAMSGLLQGARDARIPVVGEIELFAQALQVLRDEQGYSPDVLAVTGTNGKTTVTALTTWLVNSAGRTAQAAGNISPAALDALMNALDSGALPQVWVLELSS